MGRLLSRLPLLAGHRVLLHLRAAFCPQPPRGPSALVLSQLITYLGSPFLRASRFPVSRWNIFGTKVAEQKRMEGRNQPGRLLTPFRVRGNWKLDFAGRVTFADVSLSPDSSVAIPRSSRSSGSWRNVASGWKVPRRGFVVSTVHRSLFSSQVFVCR